LSKISKCRIDTIRQNNSIKEYLSNQGITPKHEYADKSSYICPFHDDTNASFFVYKTGEFENFFCFACKVNGCVIELHKRLKKFERWVDAAKDLGNSEDIDFGDELDVAVKQILAEKKQNAQIVFDLPAKELMAISFMGLDHLRNSEYNEEEYAFLEKLYRKIDERIWRNDINGLLHICEFITNERVATIDGVEMNPFSYHVWQFANKKDERLKKQYEEVKLFEER
jgi:hypothetical protein